MPIFFLIELSDIPALSLKKHHIDFYPPIAYTQAGTLNIKQSHQKGVYHVSLFYSV